MTPDKKERRIEVFFCYSHKDEALRDKLATALAVLKRTGAISGWHDRRIGAGTEWKDVIDEHLDAADIILLLVSPDFIDSDYCWDVEVKRAMERHEAGKARVIPVILRPTDGWQDTPFGKLQGAPKDGVPVTRWPDEDEALADVTSRIRRVVDELRRMTNANQDHEDEAKGVVWPDVEQREPEGERQRQKRRRVILRTALVGASLLAAAVVVAILVWLSKPHIDLSAPTAAKIDSLVESYREQARNLAARGYWSAASGRLAKARALVHEGLERFPLNDYLEIDMGHVEKSQAQVARARGDSLECAKRLAEAARHFQTVLGRDSRNAYAWNGMANIYALQGDLDSAVASSSTALDIKPDFAYGWRDLASTLEEKLKRDGPDPQARKKLVTAYEGLVRVLQQQPSKALSSTEPADVQRRLQQLAEP